MSSQKDDSFTILPADNEHVSVVRTEQKKMLIDHAYRKLKKDSTIKVAKRVSDSFKMEERNGGISKKCRHHLTPSSHHPHRFMVYLKSTRIPLYPIVASIGSPTYELAKKLARIFSLPRWRLFLGTHPSVQIG